MKARKLLRRTLLVKTDYSYAINQVNKPVKNLFTAVKRRSRRKSLLKLLQITLANQNTNPFLNVKLNRNDIILLYRKRQKGNNSPQVLNLRGADLSPQLDKQNVARPINLSGLDLQMVNFERANLRGVNFTDANLEKAIFTQANLTGVNFTGANLDETFFQMAKANANSFVDFRGASLVKANLREVEFHEAKFISSIMKNSILFKAKIRKVNFNGADLTNAELRYSEFNEAHFSSASGTAPATLEEADLFEAKILTKADFTGAGLKGTHLTKVIFNDTTFNNTTLTGANLTEATLTKAVFTEANLTGADLRGATFTNVQFTKANLTGADLTGTTLRNVDFTQTNLTGADLTGTNLTDANLYLAKLQDAILFRTKLENVDLTNVEMADNSNIGPSLRNIIWNDSNLTVIDWSKVKKIKEGKTAQQKNNERGNKKSPEDRSEEYRVAAQSYNQLAVSLRNQGLKEATNFDYESKLMYQRSLWHACATEKKFWGRFWAKFCSRGKSILLWLLDIFCGYGYNFPRAFLCYAIIVGIFFLIFLITTRPEGVSGTQALVTSINAFHGRALSAPAMDDIFKTCDWLLLVAGVEGIIGLIMEVTLIATLTQRLFGK